MLLSRFLKKGENAFNAYLELRQKTIESKITDFIKCENGEVELCAVFAMLCDFNWTSKEYGERYTSLACFSDGSAELINSKGVYFLGSAQKSEKVKNASLELLHSTEQVLGLFKKTEDFFLPDKESARIYAITKNGIYMVEYSLNFMWVHDDNLAKIRNLSSELITIIKSTNQKQ